MDKKDVVKWFAGHLRDQPALSWGWAGLIALARCLSQCVVDCQNSSGFVTFSWPYHQLPPPRFAQLLTFPTTQKSSCVTTRSDITTIYVSWYHQMSIYRMRLIAYAKIYNHRSWFIFPCYLFFNWPALLAVQVSWRVNNMDKPDNFVINHAGKPKLGQFNKI